MTKESDDKLVKDFSSVIAHLDEQQKARLDKILASDDLVSFLIWLEGLKTVGRGIGWFAWGMKKVITALVWVVMPVIVLKLAWAGEIGLGDIIKWFGR